MAKVIDVDKIRKEALKKAGEKIKPQLKTGFQNAMTTFYNSGKPGSYSRTGSFVNTVRDPDESLSSDTLTLTYTFSVSDVSVNSWDSPWGITYDGDPDKAFGLAFDEGYHGGPKPLHGLGNGWYWEATQKSDPIKQLLIDVLTNVTL